LGKAKRKTLKGKDAQKSLEQRMEAISIQKIVQATKSLTH
jgi:histone H3/H4